MELSEKNREILIEHMHKTLEEYSKYCANNMFDKNRIVQPFGEREEEALSMMMQNVDGFKSFMEKMLWQCSQSVLFDLLCIIDGVADPDDPNWTQVLLIDKPKNFDQHYEFLHDYF